MQGSDTPGGCSAADLVAGTESVIPIKRESYNPFAKKGPSNASAAAPVVKARVQRPPPTRFGYLEKLAKAGTTKWDKRYFELTPTATLNFYKKEGGRNVGTVFLKGCTISAMPGDPYVMELQSEDQKYTLKVSLCAIWVCKPALLFQLSGVSAPAIFSWILSMSAYALCFYNLHPHSLHIP